MRIHTCKVVLMTSLVWVMGLIIVLTLSSDCINNPGGWGCLRREIISDASDGTDRVDQVVVESKGRGMLYEHLHDRGKRQDPRIRDKYDINTLKKWKAAPPVRPVSGLPGEGGKPVDIPPDRQKLMKEKFKLNQFNLLASDMISLNRSLADVRQEG